MEYEKAEIRFPLFLGIVAGHHGGRTSKVVILV